MKINDYKLNGAAASEAGRTQEAASSRAQRARPGSSGSSFDHVELSGSLGRLSRAIATFQSDRAGRLQALTAQIRLGTYQPDSMAISRGVIQEALSAGV